MFLQNHRYVYFLVTFCISSLSRRCAFALDRLSHTDHLVRVKKILWFGHDVCNSTSEVNVLTYQWFAETLAP